MSWRCIDCGADRGDEPSGVCDCPGPRGHGSSSEWVASDESDPLGWWTISGSDLMRALRRVADGEDPELVYAEFYANSDIEPPTDEEDA